MYLVCLTVNMSVLLGSLLAGIMKVWVIPLVMITLPFHSAKAWKLEEK